MRESDKVKRTYRLHKVFDSMVKEYARRTGLSEIAVIESLISIGNEGFRARHRLGEESDEAKSQEKKESVDMAEKQLVLRTREYKEKNWQKICDDYWVKKIIEPLKEIDDRGNRIAEEEILSTLAPRTIWQKLLRLRKEDDWQPM